MSSNYPPGVSGLEPQITGEWPVDPHAPWMVVDITDEPLTFRYAVCMGDPDAPRREYGPIEHLPYARALVELLNGIAGMYRTDGECFCGDWHLPHPPADYDYSYDEEAGW